MIIRAPLLHASLRRALNLVGGAVEAKHCTLIRKLPNSELGSRPRSRVARLAVLNVLFLISNTTTLKRTRLVSFKDDGSYDMLPLSSLLDSDLGGQASLWL